MTAKRLAMEHANNLPREVAAHLRRLEQLEERINQRFERIFALLR